jgi:cation transport ATPase
VGESFVLTGVPNAVAVALATVGRLSPVGAAVVSNASTLLVVANSLRPLVARDERWGWVPGAAEVRR